VSAIEIEMTLNGRRVAAEVEPRLSLADFVRERARLTGTHLGCEHGVCGSCTLLLDDEPVRACIVLAVAANGRTVRTIEDFDEDATMRVLRETFTEAHALQCGFCTPAMLITCRDILRRIARPDSATIRRELAGNICRCTGYAGIVRAVELASARLGAGSGTACT
jgi:carbon-monoxide dehydrogenase small subunit